MQKAILFTLNTESMLKNHFANAKDESLGRNDLELAAFATINMNI